MSSKMGTRAGMTPSDFIIWIQGFLAGRTDILEDDMTILRGQVEQVVSDTVPVVGPPVVADIVFGNEVIETADMEMPQDEPWRPYPEKQSGAIVE